MLAFEQKNLLRAIFVLINWDTTCGLRLTDYRTAVAQMCLASVFHNQKLEPGENATDYILHELYSEKRKSNKLVIGSLSLCCRQFFLGVDNCVNCAQQYLFFGMSARFLLFAFTMLRVSRIDAFTVRFSLNEGAKITRACFRLKSTNRNLLAFGTLPTKSSSSSPQHSRNFFRPLHVTKKPRFQTYSLLIWRGKRRICWPSRHVFVSKKADFLRPVMQQRRRNESMDIGAFGRQPSLLFSSHSRD